MLKRKSVKEKGNVNFTRYFQKFNKGDRVAIVRDHTFNPGFPERIQGLSGKIEGQRGRAYIVKLKQGNKEKTHILKPVHLKKLK